MTNEIKEILDLFYNEYPKEEKILEKYITNLQEENKGWEMIFDTFSRRPYAHKYLEEKRKELNNDKIVGLDSEIIYKDYYNLKQRIDKAINYILENICCDTRVYTRNENVYKVVDILRGDE